MFSYNNFNISEEAFLLRSLREVTMVWQRGTGHASYNLNIREGLADLKLSFQLGHPGDLHLPPPLPHPRRAKGEKRKERDRIRAAAHQAKLANAHNASEETPSDSDACLSSADPATSSNDSQTSKHSAPAEPAKEAVTEPAKNATAEPAKKTLESPPPAVTITPPDLDEVSVIETEKVVTVQATIVIENSPSDKLEVNYENELRKLVLNESHLINNIVDIDLRHLSTRKFRNNLFTHTVGVMMSVKTSALPDNSSGSILDKESGKNQMNPCEMKKTFG